jgi:hypothetical protein
MPRLSLDDVPTCERCATRPVARGMCSSHYPLWRRAHAGPRCGVCVATGGDRRAATRGLCSPHDLVSRRAAQEQAGFRARNSGKAAPCAGAPCPSPRETGSLFCGTECRERAAEWPAKPIERQCVSCLGTFSTKRVDAKYCSASCRRFKPYVKQKFGITLEEYVARVRAPGSACEICTSDGNGRWLCLDHDHATGELRGTLCDPCNRGLGRARDDAQRLRDLTDYLASSVLLPSVTTLEVPAVGTCRMCLAECGHDGRKTRGYCSQVCSGRARDCRRYGLSPEQFHWLVAQTASSCSVCVAPLLVGADHHDDRVIVDHCHDSGRVRGILCNYCNLALSCFADDPGRMVAAIEYLARYEQSAA